MGDLAALRRRVEELESLETPAGIDPAGHDHSKMVASDGSPNPAFSIDADGKGEFPTGTGINEFSIDDTLAGDSDDAVPTEQAVKAYVDDNTGAYGCAFLALNSADDANQTGGSEQVTVQLDSEIVDLGNDFDHDGSDSHQNQFKAPVTGTYQLSAGGRLYNIAAGHTRAAIWIVTSNRTFNFNNVHAGNCKDSNDLVDLVGACLADMDQDDVADVRVFVSGVGGTVVGVAGNATHPESFFSGHRVS